MTERATSPESQPAFSSPTVVEHARRERVPLQLTRARAIALLRGRVGLMLCVGLRFFSIPFLVLLDAAWFRLTGARLTIAEPDLSGFQAAVRLFQILCTVKVGRAANRHPAVIMLWSILGWADFFGVIIAGGLASYAGRVLASHRLSTGWMGLSQDAIDERWPES